LVKAATGFAAPFDHAGNSPRKQYPVMRCHSVLMRRRFMSHRIWGEKYCRRLAY
jgi:hypothetical protein